MRPRVPRQGAVSANDATDGQMQCDQKKRQMADAAEGLQIGVVLGVSGQAGQASGPSRTTTSKASKPSASV